MQLNKAIMLDSLEKLINLGVLTPTKRVDLDTFICFTELTEQGSVYHQWPIDRLPTQIASAFYGRSKGESVGNYKIVAVFDMWPAEISPIQKMPGH